MDNTNFLLVNCQGLGFQAGSYLSKISSATEFVSVPAESTIYLVNDAGAVMCTLFGSQAEYDSPENHDRRLGNAHKGFDVNWQSEQMCAVSRAAKPAKNVFDSRAKLIAIIVSVAFLAIGVLVGWIIWADGADSSSDVDDMEYHYAQTSVRHDAYAQLTMTTNTKAD